VGRVALTRETQLLAVVVLPLPNILDRSDVSVPASENVVNYSKNQNAAVAHRSPVHVNDRRTRSDWEKSKHPAEHQKHDSNDVDQKSESPQVEFRWQQRLAADSLQHDA
jgi:hypothetical protein